MLLFILDLLLLMKEGILSLDWGLAPARRYSNGIIAGFPMAASEICSEKIWLSNSFGEFTASDRTKGMNFSRIGEFSGIVFTPLLTENKHFWTMMFDLTIFRGGRNNSLCIDFGIIGYSSLKDELGLTWNKAAYTCAIVQVNQQNLTMRCYGGSVGNGPLVAIDVQFQQKIPFLFGFFYDKIESVFAVLDLANQKVFHVFDSVQFQDNEDPVFAVSLNHTSQRMHVNGSLNHEDCMKEDLSYWMLKIKEYVYS